MPTVPDLSGNTQLDPRKGGKYDLPILPWKGARAQIAIGTSSVQSNKFANTARALRIAPDANMHYLIGKDPTASKTTSPYLGAGAVEDVDIKPGERIAIIQDQSATGFVTLTEDG